jgi:hypothetical protein
LYLQVSVAMVPAFHRERSFRRWKNAVTEVLNNWNKGSGGGVV